MEYTTGKKFFALDDVGVVTMWGAGDGNRLIAHLEGLGLTPETLRTLRLRSTATSSRPMHHMKSASVTPATPLLISTKRLRTVVPCTPGVQGFVRHRCGGPVVEAALM